MRRGGLQMAAILASLTAALLALGTLGVGAAGAQTSSTGVIGFGDATPYGAPSAGQLVAPVTGIAADPAGGYWLVAADGGVFSYGGAPFYGSLGGTRTLPVVAMAATPDGKGYWEVTDFGAVSAFGVATSYPQQFLLDAPMVGIAADPTGGYWLVAADGGVFSYGGAAFYGSMGGKPLNEPIVGMAATPDGKGYWLVAADGGIFSFGDAAFYGSMGGKPLNEPIVGMAATPDGKGYWLVAADGGIFSFGDAAFYGSTGAAPPSAPVVGMAATPAGGYWLATSVKNKLALPSVVDECDFPATPSAIEPARIVLACGDGNAFLAGLTWSSWTASRATATGYYTHNTCTPDCAQGTFVSTPASVTLADPVETIDGPEFGRLTFTHANASYSEAFTTTAS